MRTLLLATLLAASAFAGKHEDDLLAADRAFDAATAARGLDGWLSFFAEDARLNTHAGEIRGLAAVRHHYSKMFARKNFSLRWKPLHAEASADGTLGYTYGSAESSYTDDAGKTVTRPGRYVTVWRKQHGDWKVVTDLGN